MWHVWMWIARAGYFFSCIGMCDALCLSMLCRHYNSWDLEALRNWRFEGSTDGQSWYTIMNHVDDQALDRKGASHTWTLPNIPGAFSMFRIWQTGLNSNTLHTPCQYMKYHGIA